MNRFARRGLAVVGAAAFTLTVGGAGSAGAAPRSGPIDSTQDFKGAWLTSLTGFQNGKPIHWQHRLTVRKVLSPAAVAWEEGRDCSDQATECMVGTAAGDGWSGASRTLGVMGPNGVVHGVGPTPLITLTPEDKRMTEVVLSHGQSQTGQRGKTIVPWNDPYAAGGSTVECPSLDTGEHIPFFL